MAIFGDLQHIPLQELAHILGPQTGSLVLHSALDGRSAELHLHAGELRALFVDGFPTRGEAQLRQAVWQLLAARTGAFEFQPSPLDELSGHWRLRLTDLLREAADPLAVPEEQLPHAETRFELGLHDSEPPRALASIWARMKPLLAEGTSANELSRHLDLDVWQVRVTLYRLRLVELIVPQRSRAARPAHRPDAAPGPVQRFLGALRRLTGARA